MASDFKQDILDDSSWKSRKLWLTFFGIIVIGWGFWVSQWSQVLQGLYTPFGGFVIAILGLYFGVNASHSLIASKTVEPTETPPQG